MALLFGKLGVDLTISCITSTSKSIYSLITTILSYKNENNIISEHIIKLDIIESINLFNAIILESYSNNNSLSPSIEMTINSMHDIIKKLENELHYINNKMEYNQSLYIFKGIRSCKFDNSIIRLSMLKEIFDSRLQNFFNVCKFKNT